MKPAIADILAERSLSFVLRRMMGGLGFCVARVRHWLREPSAQQWPFVTRRDDPQ
jgi:hypothetical protein